MATTQNYTIHGKELDLSEKERAEAITLATYGLALSRQLIFYSQSEAQRKRGYAMTEAYGHLLMKCGVSMRETMLRLRRYGIISDYGQSDGEGKA